MPEDRKTAALNPSGRQNNRTVVGVMTSPGLVRRCRGAVTIASEADSASAPEPPAYLTTDALRPPRSGILAPPGTPDAQCERRQGEHFHPRAEALVQRVHTAAGQISNQDHGLVAGRPRDDAPEGVGKQ